MNRLLLVILLAAMTTSVSAASLTLAELPYSFVTRVIHGEFQINIDNGSVYSQFETDGFAAYAYLSDDGVHFLLDYDVSSGSHFGNSGGGINNISGSVFLAVALKYDLNIDDHEIDIYFDQLIPDVGSTFFFSGLPHTTVLMDADAITSGQGVYLLSGDPDYIVSGNMSFGGLFSDNHPFICVECSLFFELNLVYLDYATGFINFNPDDPRSSLMMAQDGFYGTIPYGWDFGVNVQNVPVPGSLVLFASALLGFRMTRINR